MPIQWSPIRIQQDSGGGGGGGGGGASYGQMAQAQANNDRMIMDQMRLSSQNAQFAASREVSPRDAWQAQQQAEGEERRAALDAQLYGARLSMQEEMEMGRRRNALSFIDNHPGLSQQERLDMRTQIMTGLDPLERRASMARQQLTQQQLTMMEDQNARNQVRASQNAIFRSQMDERGISNVFAPGMEEHYRELAGDVHYGENLTPQQLRNAAIRIGYQNGDVTQWRPNHDGDFVPVAGGRGASGTSAGIPGQGGGQGGQGGGATIDGQAGTTGSGRGGQIDVAGIRQRLMTSNPLTVQQLPANATQEQRTQYEADINGYYNHIETLANAEVRAQQRSIAGTHAPPAAPYRFDYRKPEDVPAAAGPLEQQWSHEFNIAHSLAESNDPRAVELNNSVQQAARLFRRYGSEAAMNQHPDVRRAYDRARLRTRNIIEQLAQEQNPQAAQGQDPQPQQGQGQQEMPFLGQGGAVDQRGLLPALWERTASTPGNFVQGLSNLATNLGGGHVADFVRRREAARIQRNAELRRFYMGPQ